MASTLFMMFFLRLAALSLGHQIATGDHNLLDVPRDDPVPAAIHRDGSVVHLTIGQTSAAPPCNYDSANLCNTHSQTADGSQFQDDAHRIYTSLSAAQMTTSATLDTAPPAPWNEAVSKSSGAICAVDIMGEGDSHDSCQPSGVVTFDSTTVLWEVIVAIIIACSGASAVQFFQLRQSTMGCADSFEQMRHEQANSTDEWGCTALHCAAKEGNVTRAMELLNLGADVDAKGAWEETPLHLAAAFGHVELCARLLANGADVNAQNSDDEATLIIAAKADQDSVVELLLDAGATIGAAATEIELPPSLVDALVRRMVRPAASSQSC